MGPAGKIRDSGLMRIRTLSLAALGTPVNEIWRILKKEYGKEYYIPTREALSKWITEPGNEKIVNAFKKEMIEDILVIAIANPQERIKALQRDFTRLELLAQHSNDINDLSKAITTKITIMRQASDEVRRTKTNETEGESGQDEQRSGEKVSSRNGPKKKRSTVGKDLDGKVIHNLFRSVS